MGIIGTTGVEHLAYQVFLAKGYVDLNKNFLEQIANIAHSSDPTTLPTFVILEALLIGFRGWMLTDWIYAERNK